MVYGLTIKDGVLSGELVDYHKYSTEGMDDREEELYHLIEAYKYTKLHKLPLTMYVKDQNYETLKSLVANGLYVNIMGILIVNEITQKTYRWLLSFKDRNTPSTLNSMARNCIDKILEHWPRRSIVKFASTLRESHITEDSRRYDYYTDAFYYQAELPVPFDKVDTTYITSYVEVNIKENRHGSAYKYTVFISDYNPLYTNKLPAEGDLVDLIKDSNTLWYKVKVFLMERFLS